MRKRWMYGAVGAALLVLLPVGLTAQTAKSKLGVKIPKIKTWEMKNGLKVAYLGLHKAPVVTVQIWYRVGSKDEARNRRGSAHMFEHMMFKGTKNVPPEEHARHLNRLGGYVNAFTREDTTAYHNTLPKEYLDFAIKLEAERMRNLVFRKDMIKKEREVVKTEVRQQENNPLFKGLLSFLELAYQKHPYAWTAGGALKDLDDTSVADLKKFYDAYYQPNNAMLVVVGDVSEAQVRASATKWFAKVARGKKPPRPADAKTEPKQTKMRRQVVAPGQVGMIISGFHIPEAKHVDIYALQVLGLILSSGQSSRLHQRLVEKDKSAVQAGGQVVIREHPGLFALFGLYLKRESGSAVEKALLDEIQKIKRTPPTARELRKAKNQILSTFIRGLDKVTDLAGQIGTSWILTGDATQWVRDIDKLRAVSRAQVQAVAKKYFVKSNMTTVVIPPVKRGGGAK